MVLNSHLHIILNDIYQTLGAKAADFGSHNITQTTLPLLSWLMLMNHSDSALITALKSTSTVMNQVMWSEFDAETKNIFKESAKVVASVNKF